MLTAPAARARMTHRAFVERDPNAQPGASPTPYGGPGTARFAPLATLPCWYWSTTRQELIQTGHTVVVEDERLMLPAGADVTERDRVSRIENRKGDVLAMGPFALRSVKQKQGFVEATMLLVKS